jgi:hypothetical protein
MSFEQGELVRCNTGGSLWVGEVVKVSPENLIVQWFGDEQGYQVSIQDAELFGQFLAKQKRTRKLKTVYSEFFGQSLKRIPQKRLFVFHQVLREHGVAFDESVARVDDFFPMWMNQAHLTSRERKQLIPELRLPESITAWLPSWVLADQLPASSRDPLGLQADAGKLANALLPGLTVFTNRVGYFFFLSWAIRELNQLPRLTTFERRELLNRLERALVLSETLYHGKDDFKNCYHQGQRAKSRLLAEAIITADLPDRILKNQNGTGCYNLYRTAMRSCGFWEDDDEAGLSGKLPFRLTPRGEKLASAFARRTGAAELLRWAQESTSSRKVQELQQWGESFCFFTFTKAAEKAVFLEGFLFAKDDRADVVSDADTRLRTIRSLAQAGLLRRSPSSAAATLVSPETAGADVSELADMPDLGENAAGLLHFYRQRHLPGAAPFVAAAIYELLGLALNAVFAGLLKEVLQHGRVPLSAWQDSLISQSTRPQFWNAVLSEAVVTIPIPEEQLSDQLFGGEVPVEPGLMLAVQVLSRENNRVILREQLADTALGPIIERIFLANGGAPVLSVLTPLLAQLIDYHHQVSERKGRERWLDQDGPEVLAIAPQSMALGFHSYRLPQLRSLVQDLQLTEQDLNEP